MAALFPWVPESGWPLPISKPIGWPDGGKMLGTGVNMATFGGEMLRGWLWRNSFNVMWLRPIDVK